jgi:SH2 domain-containing protein 4A
MLKQILEDMYVDSELLEMLNEEQKELLFREMRKEQVRRWEEREKKMEIIERQKPPKKTPAKIGFHTAKDGKEWVWVLGEAEGDLPYEDLVRKNNRKKADMQST